MPTYFIDTNIFLRTLVKEDKKTFKDCKSFLEAIKTNKIDAMTAHIVLAEVAWTLSSYYGFSKKEVAKSLKSIVNLSGLKITNSHDALLATGLYEKNNVKFIDCMLASIKEIQGKKWIVVSYDKDFDKLKVLHSEPAEVILEHSKK